MQYRYNVTSWSSRNICTSSDILIPWYHFAQTERFYGDLISSETIKSAQVFFYSARHFLLTLTKFLFSPYIFLKANNTKFHWNPSSGSRADTCRQMDRQRLINGQTDMPRGIGNFCYQYVRARKQQNFRQKININAVSIQRIMNVLLTS
jgi:hypothetical protein